jgi:hypothetical protein
MDEVEQAWRGRVFLMTWALGYPETLAWGMALNTDPEHEAWAKAMVADADDDRIRAVVQGRKEEEAASTRVGLGDLH